MYFMITSGIFFRNALTELYLTPPDDETMLKTKLYLHMIFEHQFKTISIFFKIYLPPNVKSKTF